MEDNEYARVKLVKCARPAEEKDRFDRVSKRLGEGRKIRYSTDCTVE